MLLAERRSFTPACKIQIRNDLEIPQDAYLMTFLSQELKRGIEQGKVADHGYTEISVLRDLESALVDMEIRNLHLLVKVYPSGNVSDSLASRDEIYKHVSFDRTYDTNQTILASDVVGGMFSAALVDSVYLDRDVFSIQTGFKINPCTAFVTSSLRYQVPLSDRLITNKHG